MVFNSLEFLVFIGIFLPLYFLLKKEARLILCLAASYVFYGWWDWRFLFLLILTTVIDYSLGWFMARNTDDNFRKKLIFFSVVVNLSILGFFKYFNFFIDSFRTMMVNFGMEVSEQYLNILLPIGISFYTFQSMSYTIDIYRKEIEPEKNLLRFATFVALFPQLVAGPIVRASDFLPQFQEDKKFDWDRFISGTGRVLWGFFKKMAIADSLAPFVDQCFEAPQAFSSLHLLIGVVFYSFQIYCDFSGYSDIAIGLARILGFTFLENFKSPYFSQNFSEFWTRWHISLSSWLRDYLYIPLGGNRGANSLAYSLITVFILLALAGGGWMWYHGNYWILLLCIAYIVLLFLPRLLTPKDSNAVPTGVNLMLTMLIGGLWHGANWTFVFWGFLHGLYLFVQRLFGGFFGKLMYFFHFPGYLKTAINILLVYFFTCFAWIFFRSPDFATAWSVVTGIGSFEQFNFDSIINKFQVIKGVLLILMLLMVEVASLKWDLGKAVIHQPVFRIASFAILLWLIAFFGTFGSKAFIYFQF